MKSFLLLQAVLLWTIAGANLNEGLLRSSVLASFKDNFHEMHEETEFDGIDVDSCKSPDELYCQLLCSHHSQCTHFNYAEEEYDCQMKHVDHGDAPVASSAPGMVCGHAIPPAKMDDFQCYDHLFESMDFPGNDILILKRKNATDCKDTCTKYEDCEFFTHNQKTGLCYLKSCTMLPSPPEIKIVPGLWSGYRDCEDDELICDEECSDLIVDGYDFPGLEFSRTIQPDPDRCQLICNDLPRCKFFTYVNDTHPDQDLRFTCSLKSYNMEVPAQITQKDHYHSGYSLRTVRSHKSCSIEVYDDLDFPGNDQRNVIVNSYEDCRTVCTADSLCQMWTYVDDDYPDKSLCKHCFLKNVMALPSPPVIRDHDDAVSGFSQKKCIDDDDISDESTELQEVKM